MKAQVSIEFLLILSVLIFVFLIFYVVYAGQTLNLFSLDQTLLASRNAYALSTAMNYVHIAGDGASFNMTLNKGANESISVSDFSVESMRSGTVAQAPLINSRVNATTIDKSEFVIRNNLGELEVS
jgi:hypothetical protein